MDLVLVLILLSLKLWSNSLRCNRELLIFLSEIIETDYEPS